ncbi:ras-related protein Rab-21-like [Diadema setosum]|uniref:ras-related protein Rab-21-like n=1 Tax=Diadema setosum TaxID=31175 RepID=UPI003B3AD333
MMMYDTTGQIRFHSLASTAYENAAVALLVYDITQEESFEVVKYWMNELKEKAPKDILIFVIGNKLDLESQRAVSRSSAEKYAQENDSVHLQGSARTGEGISEIFQDMCASLSRVEKEAQP